MRLSDLAETAFSLPGVFSRLFSLSDLNPSKLPDLVGAFTRYGAAPAALLAAPAARMPAATAIIDEDRQYSWRELEKSVRALLAFFDREISAENTAIAILCRNSGLAVAAVLATASSGHETLLLNTDFPAPQLKQVLDRQHISMLICDEEFLPVVREAGFSGELLLAHHQENHGLKTVTEICLQGAQGLKASHPRSKITLLTSGTTGVPKGAPRRPDPMAVVGPLLTLLMRAPFANGMAMLICPPLFHGFGLGYTMFAVLLGATMIFERRFNAANALRYIERYRAEILAGVPVMFQRILKAHKESKRAADLSSLRILITGAAPLAPALASEITAELGPHLYNLYGSTEVSFATMATPGDLREMPGSAGRPVLGVELAILDDAGEPVPQGKSGRIFVKSGMRFEGYTGGGSKPMVGGMMSTGDVGSLDAKGRLTVEGREDDMIVSGGENVFPREVEELLVAHSAVADAAVVGVADAEFGQRLLAFVVAASSSNQAQLKETLLEYLRRNIARFKIPRDIIFLDELPRNASGKVLKRELAPTG